MERIKTLTACRSRSLGCKIRINYSTPRSMVRRVLYFRRIDATIIWSQIRFTSRNLVKCDVLICVRIQHQFNPSQKATRDSTHIAVHNQLLNLVASTLQAKRKFLRRINFISNTRQTALGEHLHLWQQFTSTDLRLRFPLLRCSRTPRGCNAERQQKENFTLNRIKYFEAFLGDLNSFRIRPSPRPDPVAKWWTCYTLKWWRKSHLHHNDNLKGVDLKSGDEVCYIDWWL